jgi:dephospho-CoA kinase
LACIWDTPLLFETHLDRRCDAVVFVQAPLAVRQQRVRASRGWSAAELRRRERAQIPLGRKRRMSEYVIQNTGPVAEVRAQVRQVLQAVLERSRPKVRPVDRRSRVG